VADRWAREPRRSIRRYKTQCKSLSAQGILAISLDRAKPALFFLQVGFQVLDTLAGRLGVSLSRAQDKALQSRATIAGRQVVLAKPITFMNVSGEAVGKLTRYYKVCCQ
jgi:hypothetical protein